MTETASSSAIALLQAIHAQLSIKPCFHCHTIHNDKSTGPADLARERANTSFNIADMTEVILRGKENVVAHVETKLTMAKTKSRTWGGLIYLSVDSFFYRYPFFIAAS